MSATIPPSTDTITVKTRLAPPLSYHSRECRSGECRSPNPPWIHVCPHPAWSHHDRRSIPNISYLLDVVVAQSAAILELLAGEDKTLLIRGNALLVLDLGLDVVDGVARLDVEGNGLTRQGLDETVEPY